MLPASRAQAHDGRLFFRFWAQTRAKESGLRQGRGQARAGAGGPGIIAPDVPVVSRG